MKLGFDNSYVGLPDRFYTRQAPVPVERPKLVQFNNALADDLNLDIDPDADLAQIFSGNQVADDAEPLAMAYAGHQFGGWSPQLGDGRAILLGEVVTQAGERFDIQLKGAGRTAWSRGGDGRAWLGPVLREYVVSEAMAALGIPTTRALAAVSTGEDIMRETLLPGAVLTRVASSHIRVGTFQYFAAREDVDALKALTDYAIARHYPEAALAEIPALAFLDRVVAAQAKLVAKWMGVGFIHGVMNTDNCTISGQTIDYGPCAFIDNYHIATVYSSIDRQGRYAYGNQPALAHWNLAQLASSLLPLIEDGGDKAVALATKSIEAFPDAYERAWQQIFSQKLGVDDPGLATAFLEALQADDADFTNSFRVLSTMGEVGDFDGEAAARNEWLKSWRQAGPGNSDAMDQANPAIIPRNHQIEKMIQLAVSGDFSHFEALLAALRNPFVRPEDETLTAPPETHEIVRQTFCGT